MDKTRKLPGGFTRTINQTDLHRESGRIIRDHYRDGGVIAVNDRWGKLSAVLLIGPDADAFAAEREVTA